MAEPRRRECAAGTTLLAARNRGIKLLHMACLANNAPHGRSREEVRRGADASISAAWSARSRAASDPDVDVARGLADTHGFATAMLDVQTKLLRTA